ncbi:MAG: hypothetical protein AB8B69_17255 [Chitinophagales bacterium]
MNPINALSNFFISTCKIIGYLVITVIVYTTIHGLYNEDNQATLQQTEIQEAQHDTQAENDVVQLL